MIPLSRIRTQIIFKSSKVKKSLKNTNESEISIIVNTDIERLKGVDAPFFFSVPPTWSVPFTAIK